MFWRPLLGNQSEKEESWDQMTRLQGCGALCRVVSVELHPWPMGKVLSLVDAPQKTFVSADIGSVGRFIGKYNGRALGKCVPQPAFEGIHGQVCREAPLAWHEDIPVLASHSPRFPVLASFRTTIIVCRTVCLALAATPLDTDVIHCDICWKFVRCRGPELSANWRKVHEPGNLPAIKEFAAQIVMASETLSSPEEAVARCPRRMSARLGHRGFRVGETSNPGLIFTRLSPLRFRDSLHPYFQFSVDVVFSSRWHSSAPLSAVRMEDKEDEDEKAR